MAIFVCWSGLVWSGLDSLVKWMVAEFDKVIVTVEI